MAGTVFTTGPRVSIVGPIASRVEAPSGNLLHVDDTELVDRIRGGDEPAFTELVQRYHSTLLKVARYFVHSAASAEDVAQETWIAVIRGVERYEGRSSFKTWLLSICANRARTHAVTEYRTIPTDPNPSGPTVAASRFDQGGAWLDRPVPFTEFVEFRHDSAALVRSVREAIGTLGDPQRAVVTLRDVEGLSTEEVAGLLGLSEGNVRVILHRGRARVRAIVEAATKGTGL